VDIDQRIVIAAPIDRVFALVDDPCLLPRLQGMAVERVGAPGAARFTLRTQYLGRAYDYENEILERRAPHRLVLRSAAVGRTVVTEWDLEASGSGTTLRLRTHIEVRAGIAGLIDKLSDFKGSWWAERGARDSLEALRKAAEGQVVR
jgi:uncharacterized protein YndB with AHSA1/START domain